MESSPLARAGGRKASVISQRLVSGRITSLTWGFGPKTLAAMNLDGSLVMVRPSGRRVVELSGRSVRFSAKSRRLFTYDHYHLWVWSGSTYSLINETDFSDSIVSAEWCPDGNRIAVSLSDGGVEILDGESLSVVSSAIIESPDHVVIAWSDRETLITSYREGGIAAWDTTDSYLEKVAHSTVGHKGGSLTGIDRLGDGIVTSGTDGTLQIWDAKLESQNVFESPKGFGFESVSACIYRGQQYLVSPDEDGNFHVFSQNEMRLVSTIKAEIDANYGSNLAGFSPDMTRFAAISSNRQRALIWTAERLIADATYTSSSQYRNAKVVLVGDSGVGKSGLAFPLSGRMFEPTESTHGRQVWSSGRKEVRLSGGRKEIREVLLWDLAGQPGYRLFHRLSLRDVTIALVVFDSRNESDPFRGVMYWARALDEATSSQGGAVKLLVSARNDRGGVKVSEQRIKDFLEKGGFSGYFETSAKTADGIAELQSAVERLVSWSKLPVIVAPNVFVEIREFLIRQKELGILLTSESELRSAFEATSRGTVDRQIFHTCLQRLEAAGLVSRASIGSVWLLQPELLDNYAAWLSQAARLEPDGLGAISESRALSGDYRHDALAKTADERLMLLTAIQEVVGRGLAIRVDTEKGQILVFPSELRADLPDYPGRYNREISFAFSGPVSAIYAAITVRLVNSFTYGHDYSLYRNAALFRASSGDAVYGFAAHHTNLDDDSEGAFVVFFGGGASRERKLNFMRYIDYQLQQMAIEGSIVRNRLYVCCDEQVPESAVHKRRQNGERTVLCPICGVHQAMDDLVLESQLADKETVAMSQQALGEQERQQRLIIMPARESASQFDAFICYNTVDRPMVNRFRSLLRDNGILAWQDIQNLSPGDQPTAAIERMLDEVPVALVIFGPNSMGPWQEQEYYVVLQRAVKRREGKLPLRLIPVLLPGAPDVEELPGFARNFVVLDIRTQGFEDHAIQPLIKQVLDARRS
ncbi:TIR domain-containing protein [Micromonospora sp. NPDC047644]|uniref:TIR domain-containing protein n=1 Tax=Micromonospora sp. NPDC047644 TaxID=3157203 RepID=UPI0034530D17